jgi:hypothetical protein
MPKKALDNAFFGLRQRFMAYKALSILALL